MHQSRARYLFLPLVLAPVALVVAGALSVRFRLQGPLGYVRQFNKLVFNRLTLRQAGRPGSPFVLVQHIGRRSGRNYSTPVMAAPTEGGLFIALTYGPQTDWCRNVRAAGHATILRDGTAYAITAPELVGPSAAFPAFPLPVRLGCSLLGIREFLKVTVDGQDEP